MNARFTWDTPGAGHYQATNAPLDIWREISGVKKGRWKLYFIHRDETSSLLGDYRTLGDAISWAEHKRRHGQLPLVRTADSPYGESVWVWRDQPREDDA